MAKEKIFWEKIEVIDGVRGIADSYGKALKDIKLKPVRDLQDFSLILLVFGILFLFGNYWVNRVWWNEFVAMILMIISIFLIFLVFVYCLKENAKSRAVKVIDDLMKKLFYDFVVFVDEVNVPISNLAEDIDFYVEVYHERARKLFLLVGKIKIMGEDMFVLSEENRGEFEKKLCELRKDWEDVQE